MLSLKTRFHLKFDSSFELLLNKTESFSESPSPPLCFPYAVSKLRTIQLFIFVILVCFNSNPCFPLTPQPDNRKMFLDLTDNAEEGAWRHFDGTPATYFKWFNGPGHEGKSCIVLN